MEEKEEREEEKEVGDVGSKNIRLRRKDIRRGQEMKIEIRKRRKKSRKQGM